jgi:Fe2+ transport system protein FeoA
MEKKLSQYRQGDHLEVTRIAASGRLKNRLIELGIRRGQKLLIIRYAPLKDPLEVKIAGCNVSLRVEEADLILVRPADPEAVAEHDPPPEGDCRGAL